MGNVENTSASLPVNDTKTPSESPPSGIRPSADPPQASRPETRPSAATLAARVEAALASSARTEAALADIYRTAKFLSTTVKAVRDANAGLRRELMELHATACGESDPPALGRRIDQLQRIVEETGDEAARDRDLLVADHDEFIRMLLTDHERELKSLRARLAQVDPPADL